MAVNPGEVVQAVVEMVLLDGTIAQNVFWYLLEAAATQGSVTIRNAIASQLETMYSELVASISDEVTYNPLVASVMEWNETTEKWETKSSLGFEGFDEVNTNIDEGLPNQMAAVIVAPTAAPKVRGRKFFPSFGENMAVTGILSAAAITALGFAADEYIDDIDIDANTILHPGCASQVDGSFNAFASATVNSIMGTQRRRKPGVGA